MEPGNKFDEKIFNKIIDFAIEREKDAVQFYTDLQKMVKFEHKTDMLKELVDMEKGHIRVLEDIRTKHIEDVTPESIQNLKISDYLVEPDKPQSEMTYQDILVTAMKREEKSLELYNNLAEKATNDKTKNLFRKIASEEAKHKLLFEELYDKDVLAEN